MYGCPSADYVFNVEVEDLESGDPIEGIRVSAVERGTRERWDSEAGSSYAENYIDTIAVGTTSADGKLMLQYNYFPVNKHEIVADDIDGEANGGEYNSSSVELTVNSNDYENGGSNGWYKGTATNEVTLKLTKK